MLRLAPNKEQVDLLYEVTTKLEGAVNETETKLAKWAEKQGLNYALVRTQMVPGDVEFVAAQLKWARENPEHTEAEIRCVVFWMRMLESRAKAVVRAAA